MHADQSAHTGRRRLKRTRGQVTYLLLLRRQPCIYFYSFHMHSPSSPFILSSSRREETHQLTFSFTVIGWFKAASVNCAPPPPNLPTALHPHSATLQPPPLFLITLALFTSILQKRTSVSAGWYCEGGGRLVNVPRLGEFRWRGI